MAVVHGGTDVDDQAFTRLVDRNALWSRMVSAGDRLPVHPVVEVDLGPLHLDRLLHTGALVLLFVRYAGSPACDAALGRYQVTLAPLLTGLDAHLIAVSPQLPGRLAAIKRRHEFSFLVAADPRHTLIDALHIGFHSPGADVILGTGRSVLPFATVVVADRTGTIRFADVRPDWTDPVDPRAITAALTGS